MNTRKVIASMIVQVTKGRPWLGLIILCMLFLNANTAQAAQRDLSLRHSVGTSLFMLADLLPDSPEFVLLDYGYRLTRNDVLFFEAITWKYTAPLGIPLGSSGPDYPGSVKAYGTGLAYQRFVWEDLFAKVHAAYFRTYYSNSADERFQQGYQIFLQFRVGYHLEFSRFGQRFYFEPSIAATHWPVNRHVPASFTELDRQYHDYFLFEPGLNLGIMF